MPQSIVAKCSVALRSLGLWLGAAVIAAAPAVGQMGQVDTVGSASTPSFRDLWQAVRSTDYTVVQLRRFFDGANVTTVREELRVAANGTSDPDHELDYRGVEGEPVGSPLWAKWAQNYASHGDVFVDYGSFKIHELAKVQQNYTLHDFGPATRAGRTTQRLVVFPNRLDKAIWLVEVDAQSLVPLYTAEYDTRLRLLSEIEVLSYSNGALLVSSAPPPSNLVAQLADFATAKSYMGDPAGLIDATGATGEYSLDSVQVKIDPLNNRQTLVLGFTDGVDQLFVIETPGAPDIFAGLPLRQPKSASNTIARYRDPAMSVLLFWDDGVSFQVAGRGALVRLDSFAKTIYTKAILDT